jgi:hypothetical protein
VHPICFNCHCIFPPDINPQTFCPDYTVELFGGPNHGDSDAWDDVASESGGLFPPLRSRTRKPQVVAPIQLLSSGLRSFFKCTGIVSAVTSWKKHPRNDSASELVARRAKKRELVR